MREVVGGGAIVVGADAAAEVGGVVVVGVGAVAETVQARWGLQGAAVLVGERGGPGWGAML